MTGPRITGTELTATQVSEVLALVEAARLADGVAPLSEHGILHLRYDSTGDSAVSGGDDPPEPPRDFIVATDGAIAGYAYLDPPSAEGEGEGGVTGELVIHPERRRQGLGRALTGELVAAADGHVLRLWAHGDLPAAAALARATGFDRFRALWQMRRSLREPLDHPVLPAGLTLRTFVPGQDDDEWLDLNGRAFAKHPEQGGWTRHDLELREQEPWFDPAGFFIAERDGRMTGFHWTKVHDPGSGGRGGVVPRSQQGLGEVVDIVAALDECGYEHEAEQTIAFARARLSGDYLQTSAIFDEQLRVLSLVTDPNDYAGPGTGYEPSPSRQAEIDAIRQARGVADLRAEQARVAVPLLSVAGPARPGQGPRGTSYWGSRRPSAGTCGGACLG